MLVIKKMSTRYPFFHDGVDLQFWHEIRCDGCNSMHSGFMEKDYGAEWLIRQTKFREINGLHFCSGCHKDDDNFKFKDKE